MVLVWMTTLDHRAPTLACVLLVPAGARLARKPTTTKECASAVRCCRAALTSWGWSRPLHSARCRGAFVSRARYLSS
jgi:hypothetical protein